MCHPSLKDMPQDRLLHIHRLDRRNGRQGRIIVDSSADWGVSDPLAVPKVANLMAQRGIAEHDIHMSCYQNAINAYGQSGQFNEEDWLNPAPIDQRTLFEGNSVLRGQAPRVDESESAGGAAAAE